MSEVGRVLIAFDDGPLVAAPTWTRIDGAGDFPDQFVAGYDCENGRQTLMQQTQTGTATVYINDHDEGLFDPRNSSSPYYQKLTGRQILLQLYDPVRDVWEPQFQGHIDTVSYDIDGSAINARGEPINASIQLNCVDIFDFLEGFGLTPGYAGVAPSHLPPGSSNGVWYPETKPNEVDGRIDEIMGDVGIDSTRYVAFTGNVQLQAVKYDPDESALTALRDACDAELPFIANMYVDRYGRFVFHGRYARFDPEAVFANVGDTAIWNFHWWYVGDGHAVVADNRVQLRELSFEQSRSSLVNVAVCYPAFMRPPEQIHYQVYADPTSITAYGHHPAPPMTDLITARPEYDTNHGHPTWDRYIETFKYAELLVKNQKDPREAVTALNFKTVAPTDERAATVWAFLTQVDVSDVLNIKVGYPMGTGLTGASPADDYFVEGRKLQVRPLQPGYDYVSLDVQVSPFVWGADTHSVFPAYVGGAT